MAEPRPIASLRLNPDALYVALNRRRRRQRLSWRAVAGEAGVSPAALSRISGGRRPDADTLARLLVWLGSTDLAPYVTTEDAIDRLSAEDLARRTGAHWAEHNLQKGQK